MKNSWTRICKIVFLAGLLGLASCASEQIILSGLSEPEANEILVTLHSKNIEATKKEIAVQRAVSYVISVSATDTQKALKILVENKLPRPKSIGLAEVYPPGGGGLIPTKGEEKAKFLMALQGEIENMLKVLPGVVQARVVIVVPDTEAIRDLSSPAPKATASVAIMYNPQDASGKAGFSDDAVRTLVSSAVEGLEQTNVSVVVAANRPVSVYSSPAKGKPIAVPKLVVAEPPSVPAAPVLVSPAPSAQPKVQPAATQVEQSQLILYVFAGVAVLGLLLGIFGLARAMSLRSRLAKMTELPESSAANPDENVEQNE